MMIINAINKGKELLIGLEWQVQLHERAAGIVLGEDRVEDGQCDLLHSSKAWIHHEYTMNLPTGNGVLAQISLILMAVSYATLSGLPPAGKTKIENCM